MSQQDFNRFMRDRYYRPPGDARGGGGRDVVRDELRRQEAGLR